MYNRKQVMSDVITQLEARKESLYSKVGKAFGKRRTMKYSSI